MDMDQQGLAIILHSGSYDRIYHGLSIALTALALSREVKLLFTYWALEYLKRGESPTLRLDKEGENHRPVIEESIEQGHMKEISELLTMAKQIGAQFYVCLSSMVFLSITRDELTDQVDDAIGIATFLMETEDYQILFV
jgi:peroxiredoxin family protein